MGVCNMSENTGYGKTTGTRRLFDASGEGLRFARRRRGTQRASVVELRLERRRRRLRGRCRHGDRLSSTLLPPLVFNSPPLDERAQNVVLA